MDDVKEKRLVPPVPAERVTYHFKFAKGTDPNVNSVDLHLLTSGEEIQAAKRCFGEPAKLTEETVKASIAAFNGAAVSMADESCEKVWNKLTPKARSLILIAHTKLHNPTDKESKDFLETMEVKA